jgi:hypothetical protein
MFNYIIQVTKKKQVSKFYAPDYATAVGMARIYADNQYTVVVYKNLEVQ